MVKSKANRRNPTGEVKMKHSDTNPSFLFLPIRYILISKFCQLTDYTDKAIRRKMEEGTWVAGKHYKKAPDGHVMIDLEGYNKWVEDKWQEDAKEPA